MPSATTTLTNTTTIDHVILEVPDPAVTQRFLEDAFGIGGHDAPVRARAAAGSAPAATGFRGFTLSLVVAGPSTVDALFAAALAAGATAIKPTKNSLWGYGGVVQAPDGTLWKIATPKKKDDGTVTREGNDLVLLLGVEDVKASKAFYVEHGLAVARSFGGKYVEFDAGAGAGAPVKLALYGRKALAKDAGVAPDGAGPHHLTIAASTSAAPFTDPDGFAWAPAAGA